MIKLDDDLLQALGLGALPPEEKRKLLAHIYETLEMRVGMKLAEQMSDAQLAEFERFIEVNDEPGALAWLEANFPNYKDVVAHRHRPGSGGDASRSEPATTADGHGWHNASAAASRPDHAAAAAWSASWRVYIDDAITACDSRPGMPGRSFLVCPPA
jgi:hypothetical protein